MHVFIESAQRTPTRQAVSAAPKRCTLSIRIFKSATFGERIRRVSDFCTRLVLKTVEKRFVPSVGLLFTHGVWKRY